jgi:glycosyltransferase involved in cell wall biosynthesis
MPNTLKNTNILMLHSTSDLYGASKIFLQTAGIFKEEDANVYAFLSEEGPLSTALENIGVEVHILRLGILRRKYINIGGILNRAYFTWRASLLLSRFIKAKSIDLVFNNAASVFAGVIAARWTNKKHVWHIHEIIMQPRPFAKLLSNLMSNQSNLNIYVSDATYRHWIEMNKSIEEKKKAVRIRYGLSTTIRSNQTEKTSNKNIWNIPISDDKIIIGMIGRINHWKGQVYFIEIANELLKKNKQLHFIMAGDPFPGYEYILQQMKDKIQEFGIGEHITDLGFQKNNAHFFQFIDLLIVPSTLPDPLPNVVLEAMSHAKPVAGTSHGGIVEMILDQTSGIHLPIQDPVIAAEKISGILDKQVLRNMGEKGFEYLEKEFAPERYKSLILSSIEKILHD